MRSGECGESLLFVVAKTETMGTCTECGHPSLVNDHGHTCCVNPDCPKADLVGFVSPGEVRPQRG